MSKKDNKLHTVNKWNKPLFMSDKKENIFVDAGPMDRNSLNNNVGSGISDYRTRLAKTQAVPVINWGDPVEKGIALKQTEGFVDIFGNKSKEFAGNFGKGPLSQNKSPFKNTAGPNVNQTNPSSYFGKNIGISIGSAGATTADSIMKGSSTGTAEADAGASVGASVAKGVGGAAAQIGSTPMTINGRHYKRGMFDATDPFYHAGDVTFSDGNKGHIESGAGNVFSDIGVGAFQAGAGMGNGYVMLAGAALKSIGDIINNGWGMAVNDEGLAKASEGILRNRSYVSDATSFDDIVTPEAVSTNIDVYRGGVFTGDEADEKNEVLRKQVLDARDFALNGVRNNVYNLKDDQDNLLLANYSALGGSIETKKNEDNMKDNLFYDGGPMFLYNDGMPAINYDMAMTRLENYKNKASDQSQMTNLFAGTPSTMFDLGGDIQMHGGDYSTGLMSINAGGSHSENPNDGVQMGVDSEGIPNLVEEGETIFNDYVYSARILADDATKQKFHLPKKKDITFAEISKKLEKEASERPNDPISTAGLKAMLSTLADEQERQKQEMEAERAKAAFEALSPEEQTAIMQRAAQEEAIAQQAAQQQMAAQQPTPEEIAMAQQAQMQADGSQVIVGQEPVMAACGGKINKYDKGGELKKLIYKLTGSNTDSDYKNWLKKNKLEDLKDAEDWKNILQNEAVMSAISKNNPALAHAIQQGYDFGQFIPDDKGNVTFRDISKGNWLQQDYEGWKESKDPAWLEAVEKGLVKEGMTQEEIGKALKQTDSYQRGSKWLHDNEDNRLRYLRTILDDPNSPDVAKNYAKKFIDANGWKEGAARDYASIFGAEGKGVRETHPGTYWHTPVEAVRGNVAKNMVINDDGTIEEIYGDVPTDWTAAGNYTWATPENDVAYNYYKRPAAAVTSEAAKTSQEKVAEEEGDELIPVKNPSWLRYAGLFGPAVGLGMQAAGIGKPDYSGIDAAIKTGQAPIAQADYQPIGNYLTYHPMDIWYQQNALNAQSRATDRALANSVTPSKWANMIANGYNSQLASGNLYRQALEYNDALQQKVEEFNRGTNQFNADAYNKLSMFNAGERNKGKQYAASLALQGAAQKLDADAGWYNGIYGNVGGLFKGLGDLGREREEQNWRNALATAGVFGNIDDDYLVGSGMAKRVSKKRSCGGKLKKGKKRGLTF